MCASNNHVYDEEHEFGCSIETRRVGSMRADPGVLPDSRLRNISDPKTK